MVYKTIAYEEPLDKSVAAAVINAATGITISTVTETIQCLFDEGWVGIDDHTLHTTTPP